MIKFQRRNIGCWEISEDVDRNRFEIPLLEFNDEEEMFDYIREVLPFTKDESKYKLRISDDVVVWWTVLGFIQ